MVTRSDFIREDVELDDGWRPLKRKSGARERSGSAFVDLLYEFFLWALRLAALAGIVLKAIGAFRLHGGFYDFLAWGVVGIYFIRRLRAEALAMGERWRRT